MSENKKEKIDDPLLQDLSSALMSEKPEEHLNFKVLSKGLGFHDLTNKLITSNIPVKGHTISFNINETPDDSSLTKLQKGYKFLTFFKRASANFIDGIIIFTISLLIYNFSLFILLGDFSRKTFMLVATNFSDFFSQSLYIYFGSIFMVVWLGYFLTMQVLTTSSIGKAICGLKLTNKSGMTPSVGNLAILRYKVVNDL